MNTSTTSVISPRQLGQHGPQSFPIALGAMAMSGTYGNSDENASLRTLQNAIAQGVTLIDTGDFYGSGDNEMLIARAISGVRERVTLSVKFGALRGPDGSWTGVDNRPVAIKNFLAYTLKRLKVDYIDIYRPARLDPNVPIEDTVGTIADLIKAGYVRYVGLSEVGVDTIRRAHAVHPIADLQIEYSIVSRGVEQTILPVLRELGIGMTAYGVLSRGLLSGSKPNGAQDFRAHLPRFNSDNSRLISSIASLAQQLGLSASQLLIAYVLSKGHDIVPLIGARTPTQLEDALVAVNTVLSDSHIAALEQLCSNQSIVGTRYDSQHMASLDSERVG
jgi:aryl-alcohol dehydrogenase-like predicted oxidoreductase